jgi:hypothetical protein
MRGECTIPIASILLLMSAHALAVCPVMLVSGAAESDGIVFTFRNSGKLLIRQLEFSCTVHGSSKDSHGCRENNALFYPGMQYTLRYPYPDGRPKTVTVAVKSVTTSDGFIWKPTRKQPCRTLRVAPRAKKSSR